MNNAMIIFKKAGHQVDERLLSKALENFPTAIGTVTRAGENIHVSNDRGVPDLETLKLGLKEAHDHDVYLWLANITDQDNIKQEDIQPFVIEDDGKIVLAVMVEGDFPKFNDPKNGTDEWGNFCSEILLPTLSEYAVMAKGDFDTFLDLIHGKTFDKNMMAHVGHRGIVAVVPFKGDALVLNQNNALLGEYDWGFTTQHLDHDVVSQEPEPEVKEEKKGFFLFGKKPVKAEAEEAPKTETPKDNPVTPEAPKETKEVQEVRNGNGKKTSTIPAPAPGVRVPDSLKGKARKAYIRKALGLSGSSNNLPEGWFKDGFIIPEKSEPKSAIKDLKDLGTALQNGNKSETAIEAAKKAGEYPTGAKSVLPVISEKNKLAVMEFVAGRIDKNSQKITDPKQMQAAEAKVPTFTEATGIQIADLKKLFFADLKDFADTYPMEAALLIMELRNEVKTEEPAQTPQKTEETPAPEPQKVAAGAKKGGLFGFKR